MGGGASIFLSKLFGKDMRILMGMLILSVLHCLSRSYCGTDNFVNFQSYNLTLYLQKKPKPKKNHL